MATLRIAHRAACTASEGPRLRYALWVQGCTLGCPGCCNPELFGPAGGSAIAIASLTADILAAARTHALDGLTLVGGEPLEQAEAALELATAVRRAGLGVILFTGFTREEALDLVGPSRLQAAVDTLVCGRFDARRREPVGGRRFIGSQNQELVHCSGRYADPVLWRGPPTIDVVIGPSGAIEVVGDPSLSRRFTRALAAEEGPGDH